MVKRVVRKTTINAANLPDFWDSIDLYAWIRGMMVRRHSEMSIADLTETLKDMNTLTPDIHTDSGFAELIKAIEKRLNR